jgi:hypothetical protein
VIAQLQKPRVLAEVRQIGVGDQRAWSMMPMIVPFGDFPRAQIVAELAQLHTIEELEP